ncbi:putative disease resistance protein RGA1 [Sesamum alatum]|uniref:Disease resistance protein RGA1 n=1 Tax=Sesamum alatum TaxID=300844 RepID=A0AAE1YAR4_9LAMI|nr:putative disease resistance protein RGA1 [Sesamum alatum]
MADGIVSAVVETILGILSSAALQEIGALWGLKNDLESLESILCTVQLVLQDAEFKQRKSRALQSWLRKLKHAAYAAENVLDRVATEGLKRRADSERGMQHKLNSFLSKRNPLLFRLKMVNEVRNIRGKLDALAKERFDFLVGDGVVENRFGESIDSRQTSSLVSELCIYGRNDEKEMIMAKMLDAVHDQDDLLVYAVWGMGGLGKTTLAQLIYNDARTKACFELQIWVCVSDDFSIQRVVKAIIESIDGGVCNISDLDPLQRCLQERLRGKMFLLVLDDVWNEKHELWDRLREVLRCGSKGSILIVTTRIEKVALMMATMGVHQIGYLSEDDSWSLFKQRAFSNGNAKENLVPIGKAIVKKCGGVPLAIKALGSLMEFKSHESEWLAIKESEMWQLSDDENGILPALRLSYYNLAPAMRQCFAYCCLFPKDYVMEKKELIQLWMANGFVPSQGQSDLYLTGHLIFNELVCRSFLQILRTDYRAEVTCKMHDLMHDLAVFVMGQETYILQHDKVIKIPKTIRHVLFNSWSSSAIKGNKLKFAIDGSLRSLVVSCRVPPACISSLISKQDCLRALHVSVCDRINIVPDLVCKLEHLRYLTMSCDNIKKLPESLTRLHNLQTLKLMNSFTLLELPKGLKMMRNLWFLEMESYLSLICTPPGLGDLIHLHELSIFIVGQDASHQIDQLKELNLGGSLSIKGLENVSNAEDAKRANLMVKNNLTSLSLLWTNEAKNNHTGHYEEVLQGLQPHQNLERIYIQSYQGFRFPKWMSTFELKNLKEVTLEDCRRCEHLPLLGKLPSLTNLKLCRMDSVKCLDVEFHGDGECVFPALEELRISEMPNLEEWKIANSVENFPRLKDLDIWWCPKLSKLPFLPSLRSLIIFESSATLLGFLTFLTSLTSLNLLGFAELPVFPGGFLQNLQNLQIGSSLIKSISNVLDDLSALKTLSLYGCSNLESLPEELKNLKSLEELEVKGCDGLISFPAVILEDLSSLTSLSFENCKKLKPLSGPLRTATTLQHLTLNGLPEMEHLPESMQLFTALRKLRIMCCHGLCSLPHWLGTLDTLSRLEIENCKKMNSLPDGFKSLKSMRRLVICECPQLEMRCKKPNGEDWPKISHIPRIRINEEVIQWLDQ